MENYSENIKSGKPDDGSSYRHDDGELPGILYTMRFR